MDVLTLIEHVRDAGMELWVDGGVLRAKGSRRHQALASMIVLQRDEIIAALNSSLPGAMRGEFQELCSGDGTETPISPTNTEVLSPRPKPIGKQWASRKDEMVQWGSGQSRRLVGNGYPPITTTAVPALIVAAPKIVCPACGLGRVLSELRKLTGGLCYACWEGARS